MNRQVLMQFRVAGNLFLVCTLTDGTPADINSSRELRYASVPNSICHKHRNWEGKKLLVNILNFF